MTGLNGAGPAARSVEAAAVALDDPDVAAAVEAFSSDDAPTIRFAEQVAERRVEYDAIVEMLARESTPEVDSAQVQVVARAIAAGCLGERHLWRDLQLPSRAVLRGLFEAYFEPFAADNTMDMRWKKYVYRKLCRWGGFHSCRAPSCGECSGYEECFGLDA